MLKGKTGLGFDYEIDEKNLDNYELLEAFAEVDKNPLFIPKILKIMLGEDQKDRFIKYIREATGSVKTSIVGDELKSILSANNTTKN